MKILLSDAFHESLPGKLEKFGEVFDDKGRVGEADVVLIRSKTKVTKEYLDGASNLKLVIRGGVGLDNVDREECKKRDILVFNTAAASSPAVAELAMALMLAVPNNVIPGHNTMNEGKWEKKQLKRTELLGKTLGLFGCGMIATEVARRAAAFGMKVIGYDPYIESHDVAELVDGLDDLLAQSDYLSLHTPLTEETNGMFNKETIAKMKDGVIVVNTARGKLVNEDDMKAALESGKVRSYATDVWYSDPPDPSSPILSAPNVVMTPHIGASSKENLLRIGEIIISIIEDWQKKN
jgi:D-3-phosphoglycerate dehydrogenase